MTSKIALDLCKSVREIGELFGGLDYAAVAQRIRRTKSTYNPIAARLADHRNVKCLDLTPIFPPVVGEESDKCGIIAESGEDVAWDEVWESRWPWE